MIITFGDSYLVSAECAKSPRVTWNRTAPRAASRPPPSVYPPAFWSRTMIHPSQSCRPYTSHVPINRITVPEQVRTPPVLIRIPIRNKTQFTSPVSLSKCNSTEPQNHISSHCDLRFLSSKVSLIKQQIDNNK